MTNEISKTLTCSVDINTLQFTQDKNTTNCYQWYKDHYYPQIYYTQPKIDKGELAYKIIKTLIDEKLIDIKTVKNFTDIMDKIINIL